MADQPLQTLSYNTVITCPTQFHTSPFVSSIAAGPALHLHRIVPFDVKILAVSSLYDLRQLNWLENIWNNKIYLEELSCRFNKIVYLKHQAHTENIGDAK